MRMQSEIDLSVMADLLDETPEDVVLRDLLPWREHLTKSVPKVLSWWPFLQRPAAGCRRRVEQILKKTLTVV